ncbi:glycine receptor subunit alphaZ1-like [Ptychodera flava]|uniref:glycine receptor subunit alphaZ1-like n=1 Tax=Ptychodera flava TaxID=63121 RepID=UPI00396A3C9D
MEMMMMMMVVVVVMVMMVTTTSSEILTLTLVLVASLDSSANASPSGAPKMLMEQLEGHHYDEQMRPNMGGEPINVSVGLFITSIHSLSEISMDYGATMYLVMEWDDHRLLYNSTESIDLRSGSKLQHMVWTPDLYFVNVKEGELHQVTETNKQMRIHPSGHVTYDIRVSLVLICHMQLQRFPMDKQSCAIEMESFSYSTKDVRLYWGANFSAIIPDKVALPGFIIKKPTVRRQELEYPLGIYDHLVCEFSLDRELIFYVMEHYVPSCLLVILSWVSFWLSVEATPARASLGITTVLTLTTLSSSARNQLPKVSYTKAIDIWMLVCSIFVFAALLEFAVSSYFFLAKQKREKGRKSKQKLKESMELEYRAMPGDRSPCKSCLEYQSHLCHTDDDDRVTTIQEIPLKRTRSIDVYSRVLFPASFVIFNLIYWPAYLSGY